MLERVRKPAQGTCRFSLLEENQSKNKIDAKHWVEPEETWVSGGGRKTSCINILYLAKVHKSHL